MPVVFHFINGTGCSVRGERLGVIGRMLFRCGITIRRRGYENDDMFSVRPRTVTYYQEITDETAAVRKRAAAATQSGKNRITPAMIIPSGK